MTDKPDVQIIQFDLGTRRSREYLGDGVYVDHDDIQFWLSTDRGRITHEIALGHEEIRNLIDYVRRKTGAKI